jgi:hypothetical protein
MEQLKGQLCENDAVLDRSLQAKAKLLECEREIQTVQLQIDSINTVLNNELFGKMKKNEAKKDAIEIQNQYVTELIQQIRTWVKDVNSVLPPEIPSELVDDVLLTTQSKKADQARIRVVKSFNDLVVDVEKIEETMKKATVDWLPEFDKTKEDYDKLLKEIGGDQQAKERERKRLEKQKATFEKEAEQYRVSDSNLQAVWDTRQKKIDQLEKLHENVYQVRKEKFDSLSELSGNKLRLELDHAADHSAFEERLNELLKGGGQNAVGVPDRKRIAGNIKPRRFVELIINEKIGELATEAQITENLAKKVIERLRSVEDFAEVLTLQHSCFPADVPTIYYRKDGGEYAELSELSIGQKCTALLIIALCDGDMPVVIDQPEDALDIISVWEDIAKKLRRGKNFRQFIVTTHNSSVAVAADSDQFIVLKGGASFGKVVASGAIDRLEVRKAVIEHMEGGEEAIRLRLKKYNLS